MTKIIFIIKNEKVHFIWVEWIVHPSAYMECRAHKTLFCFERYKNTYIKKYRVINDKFKCRPPI